MPPNTKGLPSPKPTFIAAPLQIRTVDPKRLFRISTHTTGEPFFNNSGKNRFDDPNGKYKTCYFGLKLITAIGESVLHDASGSLGNRLGLSSVSTYRAELV